MKRFICAVLILIITVSSAAFLNYKIINTADDLIHIINNDNDSEKIKNYWDEHRIIFSLCLPQNKTDRIKILINNKNFSDLKEELESIKNSMKLNIENII